MTDKLTRRHFIRRTAAAGAAATLFSPASHAGLFNKTRRSSRKAVVIGSGFGGSVASLRLAEAGIPVTLVERGRHWQYQGENSYPTLNGLGLHELRYDMLWQEPGRIIPGSTGMLQYHLGGSIGVGVGAGLGGGSLVYGGVLLQPRREVFEQALPFLSYSDMDQIYYPRLLQKVSGGPIPDDILNTPNYTSMRVFIDNASRAGLDVVRSEVGFDWNVIREEVQGKRTPFASIGEYVFGCNSGAKNTLDRNYLADAQATGNVTIETLHNVSHIRRNRWSKRYEVHCEVVNDKGYVVGNHIIECQYLFMGAGAINTTKLLLKAKALGDIPLNDGVGRAWGTNGDELMGRNNLDASTGAIQGGPPSIAAFDTRNPIKTTGFMHSPSPTSGDGTQLQMGMCVSDQMSTASYNRFTDRIDFNWDTSANKPSHQALMHTMDKMLDTGGGRLLDLGIMGTWHPLGGAAMGEACDYNGKVLGTDNLFVVDGASIPGSSGAANPSLTIGANAERMMEQIIAEHIR
ncbi:GMC oxidoreductase [uncultured Alcanivorax sp.]|jgi:cholesterol oxidase|uniref:GMC oxidoreductase n=2 Tax=uncultured Alcanivorax sp. TaxID=191215 RepID=UPI0025D5DF74|nr:GMC oxidoreductase [uncultured Alcanivorax sp.]